MNARIQICAAVALLGTPLATLAQNLTGTVAAADTGNPISSATVVVTQKITSTAQVPASYSAQVDSSGRFMLTAVPGSYWVCVSGAGLYLDPCQWGTPPAATVAATAATNLALRLAKGGRFVLRVNDAQRFLSQAETQYKQRLLAWVVAPSGARSSLPLVFEAAGIREYGAVLPLNQPMTAFIAAPHLTLTDAGGTALSPQGIGFQVADLSLQASNPARRSFLLQPTATVVSVYATALQ